MFLYGCIANKSSAGMAAQLPGGHGGVRLLPAGVQTAQGRRDSLLAASRSLSPLLCLWVLLPFPSLPDSTASTLKSHLALSSLTGWSPLALKSQHPPQSNVPCHRGLCRRLGEGWAVDSQHSWPLRVSKPSLRPSPVTHIVPLGLFFLSRTLQGQTKADWQCPALPAPPGETESGAGGGVQRVLCGGGSLPPPPAWLGTRGSHLSTPPWRCRDPTGLHRFPSDWLSSLCCSVVPRLPTPALPRPCPKVTGPLGLSPHDLDHPRQNP